MSGEHKWQLSPHTTPSGKLLYHCPVCGLYDPALGKMGMAVWSESSADNAFYTTEPAQSCHGVMGGDR